MTRTVEQDGRPVDAKPPLREIARAHHNRGLACRRGRTDFRLDGAGIARRRLVRHQRIAGEVHRPKRFRDLLVKAKRAARRFRLHRRDVPEIAERRHGQRGGGIQHAVDGRSQDALRLRRDLCRIDLILRHDAELEIGLGRLDRVVQDGLADEHALEARHAVAGEESSSRLLDGGAHVRAAIDRARVHRSAVFDVDAQIGVGVIGTAPRRGGRAVRDETAHEVAARDIAAAQGGTVPYDRVDHERLRIGHMFRLRRRIPSVSGHEDGAAETGLVVVVAPARMAVSQGEALHDGRRAIADHDAADGTGPRAVRAVALLPDDERPVFPVGRFQREGLVDDDAGERSARPRDSVGVVDARTHLHRVAFRRRIDGGLDGSVGSGFRSVRRIGTAVAIDPPDLHFAECAQPQREENRSERLFCETIHFDTLPSFDSCCSFLLTNSYASGAA